MATTKQIFVILSVLTIFIILKVQAQNSTAETSAENDNAVANTTTGVSRTISKRHLHTIRITDYPGKSNYNRNRSNRNKRRRKPKPKPRRPQSSIHNYDSSDLTDFDEIDFKKQLQEDRRNRYNKHSEQLESYEDYLKQPDLENLGHIFNKDEIKDLFLTTDFDYKKIVSDYNMKLIENSRPKKPKRPSNQRGKYGNEFVDDSEGIYDFSESGNPDSSDYFYNSKYKKNDATQQLSPVLQYELDNLKDYGIHQNSYGEYTSPALENDDYTSTAYSYTNTPEVSNEDSMIKHYEDVNYTLELLKTFKKNKTQNPITNDLYPNHAPSYSTNYGNTYSFDTKPIDKTKNHSFDTLIPNFSSNVANGYNNFDKIPTAYDSKTSDKTTKLSFDTFPNDIPSFSTNYANGYNFDTKSNLDSSSLTKYSLPEWNVKHGGGSNPIRGNSEPSKDYSVDVVKEFYEMNNFHTPSYSTGISVTAKPIAYDRNNYGATTGYDQKDQGFWKDNGGWKAVDPNNFSETQLPIDIPQPIIVPVPHPYPVRIPVTKPVAVPVVKEIKVPVEKEVPYPVVKNVPYPVEKPVPVKVEKQVTVAVPKPYPVKIPIVKNVFHHSPGVQPHVEEWDSVAERDHHSHHHETQESWEEDVPSSFDYEESNEETVPKESQRHMWRNGRPSKTSKRKNNYSQFEDYDTQDYNYRPKKRNPPASTGKNRGQYRSNGRNRTQNGSKKNTNRYRPRTGTKRLRITRRQSDDDLK